MQPLRVIALTSDARLFVSLANSLRPKGCQVTRATAVAAAVQILREVPHDALILDVAREDVADRISPLLAENYSLKVIALNEPDDFAGIARCLRGGAHRCLPKPVDVHALHKALFEPVAGNDLEDGTNASSSMRLAMEGIRRAAVSNLPVMLRGEHGTGKTMFAERLHQLSRRAAHPFVTVNCPSLSAELVASELFGHRKGSFTGAIKDQVGKVEVAEGGSLFLDELGDLPGNVQARLLRFLQDRAFERLGETLIRHADVRIITATNRNLEELIAQGVFRADLFYRLEGIEITIPPLRERRGEILSLAQGFLRTHCRKHGRELRFSPATLEVIMAYDWPGNVRELSNEIQRAVVMAPGPEISPDWFSVRLHGRPTTPVFLGGDFTLKQITDQHVSQVLMRHSQVGHVARVLDIERSTLLNKRRRLGIRPGRERRMAEGR